MRNYELMVIFPMEEDKHAAARERLLGDLATNGAAIEKTDEMGERDFAYEIDKAKKGRYVLFTIKADPDKIAVMDKTFKLNPGLVRYIFVKLED